MRRIRNIACAQKEHEVSRANSRKNRAAQSIQVLILQLGAALIQRLPALLPSLRSDPIENGRVWLLSIMHFMTIPIALYGIGFWLPQMIKTASRGSDLTVGALAAIPYAAGAIAMALS